MDEEKEARVRWLDLGGKKVLMVDFARASCAESLDLIADFERLIEGMPKDSLLMLSDVSDAEYDPSIARRWKEVRLAHDEKIRASAIYGLAGLVGVAVRGFFEARRMMGLSDERGPRIFTDAQAARDWIAKQ